MASDEGEYFLQIYKSADGEDKEIEIVLEGNEARAPKRQQPATKAMS
jgi:hypothetical protein